jgi:hypothetical protein
MGEVRVVVDHKKICGTCSSGRVLWGDAWYVSETSEYAASVRETILLQ